MLSATPAISPYDIDVVPHRMYATSGCLAACSWSSSPIVFAVVITEPS